ELRRRVDRAGEDLAPRDGALHAGPEEDLAFRERRVESGACRCEPVAERRIARPDVDTGGGGLVRVVAGDVERAPTPGPDGGGCELPRHLPRRERVQLDELEPRRERLEPDAPVDPAGL